MNTVARVLQIAVLFALITACEKWSWPPYENSLRDLFAENRDQFEEIHKNMLADNLEEVDSTHARGRGYGCAGASCPRTIDVRDEQLQAKYSELIDERSIFRYTLRNGNFSVLDLPFRPTQGGDFFFSFVWSEKEASIPHCNEEIARLPSCGACYEDLDPNWYMYWRWYPQDLGPAWDGSADEGLLTPEEIDKRYEIALDECIRAGREEMGLGSGIE